MFFISQGSGPSYQTSQEYSAIYSDVSGWHLCTTISQTVFHMTVMPSQPTVPPEQPQDTGAQRSHLSVPCSCHTKL